MQNPIIKFTNIALVKEIESPENPGGLEKRVALTPEDVGKLNRYGVNMFVEHGAGQHMGFEDQHYIENGATMQDGKQIYQDKDMIIKFKGPSLESIALMRSACTLFCMAHFHSFPQRAKMLQDKHINVIAMEEILESPKVQTDEQIIARVAMATALKPFIENNSIDQLKIKIIGRNDQLAGSVRRAGNRDPLSINIYAADSSTDGFVDFGADILYFYDASDLANDNKIIKKLKDNQAQLFDLDNFRRNNKHVIQEYRDSHPPFEFGLRRIQCLHETGQAGARYGLKLLAENKPDLNIADAKVVVVGYGNVARGAMAEIYATGIKNIDVLGKTQTAKERINDFLSHVDLVVNGAEQPQHLRGKNFIISNDHLKDIISDASVVIDLVGGSETNRSPVEAVLSCTFLTQPAFIKHSVTVSALWGWPMMGMMKESTIRYSGQIADVLIGREKLIAGLDVLAPGVQRALVCGPFEHQEK